MTQSSQGHTLNLRSQRINPSLHNLEHTKSSKTGHNLKPKVPEPNKHYNPGMGNLLSLWLWVSKRLPKQCRLMLLPLFTSQESKAWPYCWKQVLGSCDRKLGLDVTLQQPPWGPAFIILAGAVEAANGGIQSVMMPADHQVTNKAGCVSQRGQ